MPDFLLSYFKTLTDEQASELALWFDGGDMTLAVEALIKPRTNLHAEWNVTN